tara:strand:+ start:212 stop:577 length:366 start_codon:yes stop_codon:yes gene_type:complete
MTATPETLSSYEQYQLKQEELADIETARCRAWGYALGAYLTGPIWPGVIAARTKQWTPFWAGLALGVVSLPFAALDLGIISSLPATGLGTYLMAEKSKEKRRKLGIHSPEQADIIKFNSFK